MYTREYTPAEISSQEETMKHIRIVSRLLNLCMGELRKRALSHDTSKLQDPELPIFAEHGPKLRELTYMSEEYMFSLQEMNVALAHHYAQNAHHPEHDPRGIQGMTLIDLLEMCADWCAAVRRHADGDVFVSIDKNQERFGYSEELAQILRNTAAFIIAEENTPHD